MLDLDGYKGSVVCPGLVHLYGPPIVYIFVRAGLKPVQFCEALRFCSPVAVVEAHGAVRPVSAIEDRPVPRRGESAFEASQRDARRPHQVPITRMRSMLEADRRATEKHVRDRFRGRNVVRVVQLADLHVDTLYRPGTRANCGTFLCCHNISGPGSAGVWGDYLCDMPVATAESLLAAIAALRPAPDFAIWTGDNPPHDMWNSTAAMQVDASLVVGALLNKSLPGMRIFPAYGNHEGFPPNLFYPPIDRSWLLSALTQMWQRDVRLGAEQAQQANYSGYYDALIMPGLRLMAINTQFGYQENFYFLLNDQLSEYHAHNRWMNETLARAERAGEKVILIGHVPPGKLDSVADYGHRLRTLVTRYNRTIVLMAFAHTHQDEFEVIRATLKGPAVGVAFIAPSATPFTDHNPAFRVFYLDAATFELLDYDQFFMNLTAANAAPHAPPTWALEYSAMAAYNLPDMRPASWLRLSESFGTDAETATKYVNYMYAQSKLRRCDGVCQHEARCATGSGTVVDYVACLATLLADGVPLDYFGLRRNC